MPKSNDLATKTFVKEVVERTEDKLRSEIKKNHNEVMNKLDSIAGSIWGNYNVYYKVLDKKIL